MHVQVFHSTQNTHISTYSFVTTPPVFGCFRPLLFFQPRLFEVPPHPCLAARRAKATTEGETQPPAASSTIQLRNFAVDLTTLRLIMEALTRSSDIDALTFHNAGLTEASVAVLVEGLQHTSVRCLGVDYNGPVRSNVEEGTAEAAEQSPRESSCRRNFASLVREGANEAPTYAFCKICGTNESTTHAMDIVVFCF